MHVFVRPRAARGRARDVHPGTQPASRRPPLLQGRDPPSLHRRGGRPLTHAQTTTSHRWRGTMPTPLSSSSAGHKSEVGRLVNRLSLVVLVGQGRGRFSGVGRARQGKV
ncbi:hypothetical protein Pcinc_011008 [Petrolisthes cinctipes]|uniref:Uncharacterized protein n=1 Tax=Petrolisthes cinctipes TaxID=88211 RepID=A0AAE1KUV6_PETCI|nr:hypothetical protein Pcinc_011008 [Petrolisthes cinctipes]